MPPLVGSQLLNARLARGWTLAEAAHETRIPERQLALMEADDYAAFGNLAYARAFLRIYSRHLDVDTSELLAWLALGASRPAPLRLENSNSVWHGAPPPQAKPRRGPLRPLTLALAVLTLILGGGVYSGMHLRMARLLNFPGRPASVLPQPPPEPVPLHAMEKTALPDLRSAGRGS
ncbi:MAG TPA: hypothetical protein DIT13_12480 [Verrucomicrobiales bacterium]|nr:hypothetical protein [Verrucomicrobiales bacterium]HRJ08157.1 helix-turn-helix transcriptional regulator [Prosthecobacter sp.]HRK14131.1 helix-turn-helix transcriptional regulator [Prosthecobacter sp.]